MEAISYNLPHTINDNLLDVIKENTIFTITDGYGRIEFASENFCRILEYNANDLIGETLELLKSPLHTNLIYKDLWKTIKQGRKWNGILTVDVSDGKSVNLDTTIMPVKSDNVKKYVIIYKDITKQVNKNQQLIKQENESKDFLKSMPLHVFSLTRYGKILNVNKPFFNTEVKDIMGNYIYDYISFIWYEVFKTNIYNVFKDKEAKQFEYYEFCSDGNKAFYSAIVSPVFNELGGIETLTLTIQETTGIKQVSKSSLNNEAKYRLIYQSINVGIIVVTDSDGNILEWNKGAEMAFGYPESEILGRSITVLTTEKYRKTNITELHKSVKKLKENREVDAMELHCLRKTGEVFPVEFTLSSLNVEGKIFYCATMLDISKRNTLKNELKQKAKDVERLLEQSADNKIETLANLQQLVDKLKAENSSETVDALIKELDLTIKNTRALASKSKKSAIISAKKHEYKRIDFNKTVNRVLKNLKGELNPEAINFDINIDIKKSYKSKPELINSILQNLVENAVKFSKLPTTSYEAKIAIDIQNLDSGMRIKVKDNGIGIPSNQIGKIFDLHYTGNQATNSGKGMGLYIVKSIVDNLEGQIHVESKEEKGTHFIISLP